MSLVNPGLFVARPGNTRIDTHVHLWQYDPTAYGWIDDRLDVLRRDFLFTDLAPLLVASGVGGAIAVQATRTMDETRWLLSCMRESCSAIPRLLGVVGWVPLTDTALASLLDSISEPGLSGIREFLQDEPAGALGDPALSRGIRELTARELAFDLLLRADQLGEAVTLVDQHPHQNFILDHAGKPPIASGDVTAWTRALQELALRPNVCCKVSGLVTEAEWASWTPQILHPVMHACVEAFGTSRLLVGSDWPVCLLATRYAEWQQVLTDFFAPFSEEETAKVFGGNAARIYRLPSMDVP